MQLTPEKIDSLRAILEPLLLKSWDSHAMDKDPVGLVHNYIDPLNIEVVGLITSCFSYGKQSVFRPLVEKILNQMGNSPVDFILSSDAAHWRTDFDWFKYRFNNVDDLVALFTAIQALLKKYDTIEKAFGFDSPNLQSALGIFVDRMYSHNATKSFRYLFPHPVKGSACKRLNMYIRWMCRHDKIDVGIWKFDKSKLIIPLDTHVCRISKDLGLTVKSGNGWAVAEDITDSLRQLDPVDPLKFDFAICNAGVLGLL